MWKLSPRLGKTCVVSYTHRTRRTMVMQSRTYDDAINHLNTLQTPFGTLKARWDAGHQVHAEVNNLQRKALAQIGYTQDDLSKLNIVHVAGTKGKGSTCAYVDSILQQHRKTRKVPSSIGLFTSPHLIAVRERIRINSAPLSAALFARYFFEVWDRLDASTVTKPPYFRFLALMSYHVFLQERVDCAIYEVGVGGEFDSTNIVERPAVTGISSLGIDHVYSLGDTIESIAWHKGGIMKRDVAAFTSPQVKGAQDVLNMRADEKEALSLEIVAVDKRLEGVRIRPDADFQRGNASLAIRLAETVLQKLDRKFRIKENQLPRDFVDGLEKVVWRGRCEKKVEGKISWYLDGAHTTDSITVAAKWFCGEVAESKSGTKVLIFNQQGHREAVALVETLYRTIEGLTRFDHVIFCTTSLQPAYITKQDHINHNYDPVAVSSLSLQKEFASKWESLSQETDPYSTTKIQVIPSLEEAVEYVRKLDSGGEQVGALITGSVHLIGRALGILEGVDAL